jgi:hypothetical protein
MDYKIDRPSAAIPLRPLPAALRVVLQRVALSRWKLGNQGNAPSRALGSKNRTVLASQISSPQHLPRLLVNFEFERRLDNRRFQYSLGISSRGRLAAK